MEPPTEPFESVKAVGLPFATTGFEVGDISGLPLSSSSLTGTIVARLKIELVSTRGLG